jgi:hypothetical protein
MCFTTQRRSSCWFVSNKGVANLRAKTGRLAAQGSVIVGYHPTAQPGKELRARNVLAHWLYSPLSLLAAFPDITRRSPRSHTPLPFGNACGLLLRVVNDIHKNGG